MGAGWVLILDANALDSKAAFQTGAGIEEQSFISYCSWEEGKWAWIQILCLKFTANTKQFVMVEGLQESLDRIKEPQFDLIS